MLDNTDLIDRYLAGELSVEEKQDFERLLFDDSDSLESKKLREEMELQKEIILAIQSRGLRECLQEKEQQKLYNQQKKGKIIKIFGWSSFSTAIAAVLLWGIFIFPVVQKMENCSIEYAQQIQISAFRGGATDDLHNQLMSAYQNISDKNFEEASQVVLKLKTFITENRSFPYCLSPEEKEIYDQAQWLYVICEMNEGHIFKVRRLLKQIGNSDSFYATQAQDMLDKLKR
jgi:CRISPR/Cas system-associated endoribonuclease Cas2